MKLQKLQLRNFKGVRSFSFDPGGKSASVFADNRVGKTTLFDAYCWLLFDKDSRGRSTGYFSLKTKEGGQVVHQLEHEVEGLFSGPEIDGASRILLRKVYKEKWTRKRGSANETFQGHTTDYYIDDVEVKMSDYQDQVNELIEEGLFKILSDPIYFAQELSKEERRQILLDLCPEITTEDIIGSDEELLRYPEILGGMDREKREEKLKGRRRKLDKQLGNIPDRIDENRRMIEPVKGIEDAKSEIASLQEKKETIQGKKSEVKSGGRVAELNVERQELQGKYKELENEHRDKVREALSDQRQKVSDLEDKVDEIESEFRDACREGNSLKADLESLQDKMQDIDEAIEEARATEPKPASAFEPGKCPVCERPYEEAEEHDYEQYLEEFNASKADEIKHLEEQKQQIQSKVKDAEAEFEEAKANASNIKGKLSQRKEALRKAKMALEEQKAEQPDFVNEEIEQRIEEIDQKISNHRQEKQDQLGRLDEEIQKIDEQIAAQQKILNTAAQNRKAERRIAELREEQEATAKELEQVEADLHVIDRYVQAESEFITRQVNTMFDMVEWQLFEEQINGGIKPVCTALVDGIPFDAGLNDGHRIRGGIDIINTLSGHYGLSAPVWVDGAESVTGLPDTDLQIIALIVSKPDKELRVEQGLPQHQKELAAV